jgi:hypothetical protein
VAVADDEAVGPSGLGVVFLAYHQDDLHLLRENADCLLAFERPTFFQTTCNFLLEIVGCKFEEEKVESNVRT